MEVKQLPKREELPENLTWDLTKIFSSDQEFDEKYLELSEKLKKFPSFVLRMQLFGKTIFQ